MKQLFSFLEKHPKKRFLYAITGGFYLGELFVFIEKQDKDFNFLSLPEMKIRTVPCDKFSFGLDNKIIDVVEQLPKQIYNVCIKQYQKNKTKI